MAREALMAERVGFVGLGTMGLPMARNLLRAGHRLRGFDLDPSRAGMLADLGGVAASSAADAARGAAAVITMLPASRQVEEAVLGPGGVLEGLEAGATLIDMSTIDPSTTRRVEAAVRQRGARMLDAPVSGGAIGAERGTLTIMVGGDAEVLDRVRDLLAAMGTDVVHCGAIGMGETVKLANQILAGTAMVAVAEAFALGIRLGADPRTLLEVIGKSTGSCWMLRQVPVPGLTEEAAVNRDFAPGFRVDLMHKDLGLALGAGDELGLPLTLTAVAHQLYGLASRHGHGPLDVSAVARLLEGPDEPLWQRPPASSEPSARP
jgi:3-hydroxyisobutyrate dehydrogenase